MMGAAAMIGFGEAGSAFAGAMAVPLRAYDIKTEDPATREAMLIGYAAAGVEGQRKAAAALHGAPMVLSLVTASSTLSAAQDCASLLAPGALWIDMNSVAPDTKRRAAAVIEAGGGRYIDAAIMAPVRPAVLAVPVLLSGPHADEAASALAKLGFTQVRCVGAEVGRASTIKMLRSVMVKGIEALTAEMMQGAAAAGVADEVLGSLGEDWAKRADYNLERMTRHGLRRAAEMEEVAATLTTLGVEPVMTRGTIARQREMAA